MRKITVLILCLLCIFTFASCNGKDKQKQMGTDVGYYAELGQIPEIEFKIGDNPDSVIKKYEENRERIANGDSYEEIEDYLGTFEDGKNSYVATSGTNYFFDCDNRSAGLNRILTFNGGFGFENGALVNEVTACMESYGHKPEERKPDSYEMSAFGLSDGAECLEYKFEKNTVAFFFEDSALCAISLTKN